MSLRSSWRPITDAQPSSPASVLLYRGNQRRLPLPIEVASEPARMAGRTAPAYEASVSTSRARRAAARASAWQGQQPRAALRTRRPSCPANQQRTGASLCGVGNRGRLPGRSALKTSNSQTLRRKRVRQEIGPRPVSLACACPGWGLTRTRALISEGSRGPGPVAFPPRCSCADKEVHCHCRICIEHFPGGVLSCNARSQQHRIVAHQARPLGVIEPTTAPVPHLLMNFFPSHTF